LEQFEFPFQRIFAQQLDAGNLNAGFDALIFVDGAFPEPGAGGPGGGGGGGGAGGNAPIQDLPEEYRNQVGNITPEKTIPKVRSFLEAGGTVVAIGSSAVALAHHLNLPVEDHLSESGSPLPRTKYYVPGSLLQVRLDTTLAATRGMLQYTDVFFDNSPVWRLQAGAAPAGISPIAWFDSDAPLRSGWAWGQQYLKGGVTAFEARLGKGRLLLFGAEILQRAQPHGTFKFLFNAIY